MADPHDEDSEPRWFGVKRPRLKWILLAVLVVDVVVVGSLVAANLASGAKPMPAGPTEQIQPKDGTGPSSPPARVCGNAAILGAGPTSAPAGAVTVPAGSNVGVDFSQPHTTYWFAPGVHPGQRPVHADTPRPGVNLRRRSGRHPGRTARQP
ncbi:MAG TPA: hypothetical protein VHS32_36595, partial [Streptosporangiaceae bacterium]|nr:hypothetical protein [Streptosporangiaceae bacterium]